MKHYSPLVYVNSTSYFIELIPHQIHPGSNNQYLQPQQISQYEQTDLLKNKATPIQSSQLAAKYDSNFENQNNHISDEQYKQLYEQEYLEQQEYEKQNLDHEQFKLNLQTVNKDLENENNKLKEDKEKSTKQLEDLLYENNQYEIQINQLEKQQNFFQSEDALKNNQISFLQDEIEQIKLNLSVKANKNQKPQIYQSQYSQNLESEKIQNFENQIAVLKKQIGDYQIRQYILKQKIKQLEEEQEKKQTFQNQELMQSEINKWIPLNKSNQINFMDNPASTGQYNIEQTPIKQKISISEFNNKTISPFLSIQFQNLSEIINGFQIEVNKQEYIELFSNNNQLKFISITGFKNSGKSLILDKLFEQRNLKLNNEEFSGFLNVYNLDQYSLFIQSGSIDTPFEFECKQKEIKNDQITIIQTVSNIDEENKEKFPQINQYKLEEKLIFDQINKNSLCQIANLILIVVDSISQRQQIFIQQIQKQYTQKQILVVHNIKMKATSNIYDQYIQKIPIYFNNLKQELIYKNQTNKILSFQDPTFNENFPLYHIFYFNQDSEKGKQWNQTIIKFIHQKITYAINAQYENLIQQYLRNMEENIQNIIQFDHHLQGTKKEIKFELKKDQTVVLNERIQYKYSSEYLQRYVEKYPISSIMVEDYRFAFNNSILNDNKSYVKYELENKENDIEIILDLNEFPLINVDDIQMRFFVDDVIEQRFLYISYYSDQQLQGINIIKNPSFELSIPLKSTEYFPKIKERKKQGQNVKIIINNRITY